MMPERDKESRRSMLQVFVLRRLQKGPVKTITALAEAVNSQRPSVSRSLRLLREDGLVEQSDQGWCLTDAGLREAQEAETKLAAATKAMAEKMTKMLPSIRAEAFKTPVAVPVLPRLGTLGLGRTSFADVIKPLVGTQRLKVTDAISLCTQQAQAQRLGLADAIKPLAEAQRLNLRLLTEVTAPAHAYIAASVARRNNLLLTGAMENALALNQSVLANLTKDMSTIGRFAWALPRFSEVTHSFGRLFAEQSSIWRAQPPSLLERPRSELMVLPTATVASYTDSLRWLDEAETDTPLHPLHTPTDGVGDEGLDPLLAEIDPLFVEMRQGSWQVLRAGRQDCLRHAAVSQREMLLQLLRRLVPDTALSGEARGKPSVKARARIILSRRGANFVDAVAKALFEFYNQLNRFTHQNETDEASLRAILQTGEGLIRFILVQVKVT